RGDIGAVAPGLLGVIERLVYLFYQFFPCSTAERILRNTNAYSDALRASHRSEIDPFNRLTHPLGSDNGSLDPCLRHQHDELLAAIPGRHIVGSQLRRRHLGGSAQHYIADVMAVVVIDALEKIYIKKKDG